MLFRHVLNRKKIKIVYIIFLLSLWNLICILQLQNKSKFQKCEDPIPNSGADMWMGENLVSSKSPIYFPGYLECYGNCNLTFNRPQDISSLDLP